MTGVISADISMSSCYKVRGPSTIRHHLIYRVLLLQVDQRWSDATLEHVFTLVPDYEVCRTLCEVRTKKTNIEYVVKVDPPLVHDRL